MPAGKNIRVRGVLRVTPSVRVDLHVFVGVVRRAHGGGWRRGGGVVVPCVDDVHEGAVLARRNGVCVGVGVGVRHRNRGVVRLVEHGGMVRCERPSDRLIDHASSAGNGSVLAAWCRRTT